VRQVEAQTKKFLYQYLDRVNDAGVCDAA